MVLDEYQSIEESIDFDVKISYTCETATLTVPAISPFTDGSYNVGDLAQIVVHNWTSDSDLFAINSY